MHAYDISGCRLLPPSYPASRACFCLLFDRGKEKEALLESRRSFELAAARTSRLVNLVFSRQTGCFYCEHPFIKKAGGHN